MIGIIAGNNLVINATTLDNVEVAGERHISDVGKVFHYWRIHEKGGDRQGKSAANYIPPNLTMQAGNDLLVQGADAIAGQDLTLVGKNVTVSAAEQGLNQRDTYETRQSGLTLALSGVAGSALNTAVTTAKAARAAATPQAAARWASALAAALRAAASAFRRASTRAKGMRTATA